MNHHAAFMRYFERATSPTVLLRRGNMIVEGRVRMATDGIVPAPFLAGAKVRVSKQYGRTLVAQVNGGRGSCVDVVTNEDGIKCVHLDGVFEIATWPQCYISLTSSRFTLSAASG